MTQIGYLLVNYLPSNCSLSFQSNASQVDHLELNIAFNLSLLLVSSASIRARYQKDKCVETWSYIRMVRRAEYY